MGKFASENGCKLNFVSQKLNEATVRYFKGKYERELESYKHRGEQHQTIFTPKNEVGHSF